MWMAEARDRQQWNHTSWLLAMTANCHRDPKKSRVFRPRDFHPYRRRRSGIPIKASNVSLLKDVFLKEKKGR